MLLSAVALASGVTLECSAAGIGLFDSGLGCTAGGELSSSCEILAVTTTCGVSVSCDGDGGLSETITRCTFPNPASDCDLTVKLQDGTQRTLHVSVFSRGPNCSSSRIYGVGLPLQCQEKDAAADATDAMPDASDAMSDTGVDATSD